MVVPTPTSNKWWWLVRWPVQLCRDTRGHAAAWLCMCMHVIQAQLPAGRTCDPHKAIPTKRCPQSELAPALPSPHPSHPSIQHS